MNVLVPRPFAAAAEGGWEVSTGCAYPVESGVPYALLADAFVPKLAALELLRFVMRQVGSAPLTVVCTYDDSERDRNEALRSTEQSLLARAAARELTLAREQMRELGARPPARATSANEAVDGLTARELEMCPLVAARRSNRANGAALDISPRTVSTHLSNVFAKLGVATRGELTDCIRQRGLDG